MFHHPKYYYFRYTQALRFILALRTHLTHFCVFLNKKIFLQTRIICVIIDKMAIKIFFLLHYWRLAEYCTKNFLMHYKCTSQNILYFTVCKIRFLVLKIGVKHVLRLIQEGYRLLGAFFCTEKICFLFQLSVLNKQYPFKIASDSWNQIMQYCVRIFHVISSRIHLMSSQYSLNFPVTTRHPWEISRSKYYHIYSLEKMDYWVKLTNVYSVFKVI